MSDFKRDRWNRPLVTPPSGKGMVHVPYARPSSLGKILEDSTTLSKWMQRQVAYGVAVNPHLQQLGASVSDPTSGHGRKTLTDVVERAMEATGSTVGADWGTAVHSCVETMITGGDVSRFPDSVREAANTALMLLINAGLTPVASEQAVVNDEIEAAGTFDLLCTKPGRPPIVVDLKTSKAVAVKYSGLSWAVQLATYSYSEHMYDVETEQRIAWEQHPSFEKAIILHVPSDKPDQAGLVFVDIIAGWHAAKLATRARAARKHQFVLQAG